MRLVGKQEHLISKSGGNHPGSASGWQANLPDSRWVCYRHALFHCRCRLGSRGLTSKHLQRFRRHPSSSLSSDGRPTFRGLGHRCSIEEVPLSVVCATEGATAALGAGSGVPCADAGQARDRASARVAPARTVSTYARMFERSPFGILKRLAPRTAERTPKNYPSRFLASAACPTVRALCCRHRAGRCNGAERPCRLALTDDEEEERYGLQPRLQRRESAIRQTRPVPS
jgi:hypothetical protein